MNGYGGQYGQPPSAWQEHRTPDGRPYYYHAASKTTQWTKPEEMMTPAELALSKQPWKEYTAEGGQKYWYNTETKESSWEMPEVYKTALGINATSALPTPPAHLPAAGHASHRDVQFDSRQSPFQSDPKTQVFVPSNNDPEYATAEEAEAAFVKLLKRCGVQPDWNWEQAIRATARDPQFRAIKDPKDRKEAFEKYCRDVIIQDKERAKERLTKLRADFETMLKRHPEIVHYTRWKTARPMIEGETLFRSTDDESERRQLFEEYIIGLKKAHAEEQTVKRKSAMDGLVDLLPKLSLEPYTRWADAQGIISSTQPFQNDEKYQALTQFDILTAFQSHMKALERAFNDSKQEAKNRKFRKERQNRDAFKALLGELRKDGKINAGTKWSAIVPHIEKDDRYLNMAGQAGSTPQELFWDVVEEEERGLRGRRNDVSDVMQDKRFELTPTTDFQEFLAVMKDDRRTANIEPDVLKLIFDRERDKRPKRDEDRHQRRAIDDLRTYLKRMEPPISSTDTYEKVRPLMSQAEEFLAVRSEDGRRAAFDRHIRRLKEKEEDAERRERRHGRASVERDRRERDRSRGERSHRSNGRPTRRSRSPEVDPYEADRRKAIAERERNHRKSTMAENLLANDRGRLSPPPRRERERERDRDRERERDRDHNRDREHRDRDRDYDRPRPRRDDDAHYDRERRDREEERERVYRRRLDRGSYDELPYGDDRPATSRRRRPEDEDDYARRDSRDSKVRCPLLTIPVRNATVNR
jgi:pre-mRNA-processing factor 40